MNVIKDIAENILKKKYNESRTVLCNHLGIKKYELNITKQMPLIRNNPTLMHLYGRYQACSSLLQIYLRERKFWAELDKNIELDSDFCYEDQIKRYDEKYEKEIM